MASNPKGTTPFAPINAYGGPFRIGGADGMSTTGGIGTLQRSAARPLGDNSAFPDIDALRSQGPQWSPAPQAQLQQPMQFDSGPFGLSPSFNPLDNRINEIIAEQSDVGVRAPDYRDIQQALDIIQLYGNPEKGYAVPRMFLQPRATPFDPGTPGYEAWQRSLPPAFLLGGRHYRENPGIGEVRDWESYAQYEDKAPVQRPEWIDTLNAGETPQWLQDIIDRGGQDYWRD